MALHKVILYSTVFHTVKYRMPESENLKAIIEHDLEIDKNKYANAFLALKKKGKRDHVISLNPYDYQADLCELPDDKGWKYLFVLVNVTTRKIYTISLKKKDETAFEFGEFLKNNKKDVRIDFLLTDSGGEFTSKAFKDVCKKYNIKNFFGSPKHKNHLAIVEYYIGLITKYLYQKMSITSITERERLNLKTMKDEVVLERNRQWERYVSQVVMRINAFNKLHYPKFDRSDVFDSKVLMEKNTYDKLPKIGDVVYPTILHPTDTLEGKRFFGNAWRYGDVHYDHRDPHKIDKYVLRSGRPIRFKLSGIDDRTFLLDEILVAKDLPPKPEIKK